MNTHLLIVVPCYNEEAVLPETNRRLSALLQRLEKEGRIQEGHILYVDDGSRDGTWTLICSFASEGFPVRGLKLAHNVGHQHALWAGLEYAASHADVAISIDADLQDDVEVIPQMIDYYRQGREVLLAAVFVAALIAFSGLRGLRMVLSFVFAFLSIWKLLIPSILRGMNPLLMCTATLILLTLVTLPMVSGINRRSLAAILGSVCAMVITVLISVFMTWYLRIHGSVLEMSESLLYSGFMDLDLTSLFSGVVCLSAGGAIMDLSIDVSAAMWEVREHAPDTTQKELFHSAMEVGKAGVGTQITTLLLAYMGSYLTLMMVYMAQATPIQNIFASKSIASEILQTLAGSFGIVLVTPLTALIGMMLFRKKDERKTG